MDRKQKIIDWIEEKGGEVSRAELSFRFRKFPHYKRWSVEVLDNVLLDLIEDGILASRVDIRPDVPGRNPVIYTLTGVQR